MTQRTVLRSFAVAVLAAVLTTSLPARAEVAPRSVPAAVWQWMAGLWPGSVAAAMPGSVRSPRSKDPRNGRTGGCVDPDGIVNGPTVPVCDPVTGCVTSGS
ncbi:MAG TPA: hypothetical protein VGH73_26170 [Thermoanaerobaculia bacterium]|jgi:hypothetical protein